MGRVSCGDGDGEHAQSARLYRAGRPLARVSKSWRHHETAIWLDIAFYNFVRVHSTIKATPVHRHGLTDHAWSLEELLTAAA